MLHGYDIALAGLAVYIALLLVGGLALAWAIYNAPYNGNGDNAKGSH